MYLITDNIKADYKLLPGVYLKDLLILGVLTSIMYLLRGLFLPALRLPIILGTLFVGLYFLSPSGVTPFYSRYKSLYAGAKYTKDPIYFGSGKSSKILTSEHLDLEEIDSNGSFGSSEVKTRILQIAPRDLYSLNEANLESLIGRLNHFYRNYEEDLKWLTLRFPVDFSKEKDYLKSLLHDKPLNERTKDILRLKIHELEVLEEESQNLEYFLFVYGKTEQELEKNVTQVQRLLLGELNAYEIDKEKTEKLLSKLMNQNTKI